MVFQKHMKVEEIFYFLLGLLKETVFKTLPVKVAAYFWGNVIT